MDVPVAPRGLGSGELAGLFERDENLATVSGQFVICDATKG
jgi:hypothetical protein